MSCFETTALISGDKYSIPSYSLKSSSVWGDGKYNGPMCSRMTNIKLSECRGEGWEKTP